MTDGPNFLSFPAAKVRAVNILRPYLAELSPATIETLTLRMATELRNATYTSYQRGLDTPAMGGDVPKAEG